MSAVYFIPLSRGKVATIDFSDFEKVRGFSWCAVKAKRMWYALSNLKREKKWTTLRMHRLISGAKTGQLVDHKDGDGLNNRRDNLRFATNQQNQFNQCNKQKGTSSRFKRVCFNRQSGKWTAAIQINRKQFHLGYFSSEIEAARAYDAAAKKEFGKFARPNFV